MTDTTTRADLLPCPFCRATGLAVTSGPCAWNNGGIAWNVTCHTRDCHGGIFALGADMFATPAEAIAAWNTRAPTADAERIAALEGALRPFARAKHIVATVEADGTIRCILTYAPDADQTFTLASLDAARAALKGTENDPA